MTAASNDPADIIFDKMMTAAIETCDALTEFYCHMEDARCAALAGNPLPPEMETIKITSAVHDAHDRYFTAACEFEDLSGVCAECQTEEAAKAPAPAVQPAAPVVQIPAPPAAKPAARPLH